VGEGTEEATSNNKGKKSIHEKHFCGSKVGRMKESEITLQKQHLAFLLKKHNFDTLINRHINPST
jgi:hypothetical protein